MADEARAAGGEVEVAPELDDISWMRPRLREHGDWASNIALRVAAKLGRSPRDVAQHLAVGLAAAPGVLAKTIVDAGAGYGRGTSLADAVINLEFVSANPTGPLHIGHTRWAALGDSIARVLRAAGAQVTGEYYINDAGTQM